VESTQRNQHADFIIATGEVPPHPQELVSYNPRYPDAWNLVYGEAIKEVP